MRSDLARAPVNLQHPPGLDDYKKTSSGSYGVPRQPSAGRKPPQGKIVLPEFPRRAAVGSGSGSYAALGGAARSTSVPRPSSRTSATQISTSAGGAAGAGSHAAASSTVGGSLAGTAASHTSPRGVVRPPAASGGAGSILDSLATPSVLSGGTRASLAQRMNSSSVLDYGMLAGGPSTSAVRIKRQAGSVSGDAVATAAGAAAAGAQPGAPQHYSTLTLPADQLRAMYLSGPAAGTSGGVVGGPAAVAAAVGGTGAGRRASTDRAAVERIISRNSSFSSQSGGYGVGVGGPASPVAAGTGTLAAAAPAPPGAPSPSYHSAADSQSRLAGGAVYASQYAHQYGSTANTVYIPTYSQHAPAGAAMATYGGGGGSGGGAAAVGVHYAQQQQRPPPLSVSAGAPLPPVVLSPSSPSAAAHFASSGQTYSGAGAADYAAVRSLQRSGSTTLSRPVVGGGGGAAAATLAAGRLRALSTAADDDATSVDGGSGSSSGLRRLHMQMQEEQPRRSGNGAAVLPPPAPTAAGLHAGPGVAAHPASPKPAASATAASIAAGDHLPTQPRSSQPAPPPQQQQQQPHYHAQHPHPHPHPQLQPHSHPHAPAGAGGVPAGAALDAGGSSYTSTASSAASAASGSSSSGGSSSSNNNKSSVAAAGTRVSSASTSRSTSSISQRSAADASAAHAHAGAGPTHGSSAAAAAATAARHTAAGVGAGGALARAQSGLSGAAAPPHDRVDAAGPVCGPLPDLPLVAAPRDASPGRGCVGLQNLGNTCFMNSILQSLNAVPELVQQFLNPSDRHWSSKALVAPAYSGLVREMMCGAHGGCVNPSAFVRKVSKHDSRWGDGRQQDSQEFLNSLLEALQTECNRITSKPVYRELQGKGSEEAQAAEAFAYARSWNDSIVDDIFGGLTQSTIQCHACKRLSHTFEPFLGLAVPIPAAAAADGGSVTVADCLRAFAESEELQGDDSYKCEACKRRQPHSKRIQIFRPPRVLVLTLKRFAARASPGGGGGSPGGGGGGFFSRFRSPAKNNAPVRLDPEPLDLAPYCNPLGLRGLSVRGRGPVAPLYQLVAVSHHSGSLEGGHYTAQARSCLDGQWYSFNDSCVRREAARPSGTSSSAYVLFYRLANLPPPLPVPPPPGANSNL